MAQLQPQTTLRDQAAIDRLAERYTFREPDEVSAYLAAHPRVRRLLEEAAEVAPRYFGPETTLVLEISHDPEIEEEYQELYALIGTPLATDDALDRLNHFDEEWLYRTEAFPADEGVVTFDIGSA